MTHDPTEKRVADLECRLAEVERELHDFVERVAMGAELLSAGIDKSMAAQSLPDRRLASL